MSGKGVTVRRRYRWLVCLVLLAGALALLAAPEPKPERVTDAPRVVSAEAEACVARLIGRLNSPARPPTTPVVTRDGTVTRFEPDGTERWSRHLGGYLSNNRLPDTVTHDGKTVVVQDSLLVALDDRTGRVRWTSEGPTDHLHATDDLVIAVDCTLDAQWGHRITARRLRDGAVAWRVPQANRNEPDHLLQAGNLLFVRHNGGITRAATLCLDTAGTTRFKLGEYVFSAHLVDDDLLIATTRRVARLKRDGHVVWETGQGYDWDANWPFDTGEFVSLAGGDVLVVFYGPISDSGVEVWRLDAGDGRIRWKACCEPLFVGHSEYSHEVRVTTLKQETVVLSQGSAGSFIEVLSLDDGKQLKRVRLSVPLPTR